MSYVKTIERYGRVEAEMDLPRFAADLAKELGGKILPGEFSNTQQQIAVGTDVVSLSCHTYRKPVRVHVYISAPDVKHDDRNHYDKTHKTQSASVNPEARSIASIARDIKRRVIEASQEALTKQREYAVAQQQRRDGIKAQVADLTKMHPGLDVRLSENDQRAQIYNRSGSHHLSACMYANGEVSIERVGSVTRAQFDAIMRVLNGSKS